MNPSPNHHQVEIGRLLFGKAEQVKRDTLLLIDSNPDYGILKVVLAQLDWLISHKHSGKAMEEESLENLTLGIIAVRELDGSGVLSFEKLGAELSEISSLVDEYSRG